MKKVFCMLLAAVLLALCLAGCGGGEALMSLLPEAEWSWMVGGPAQYDTPGADVFAAVELRNHPDQYEIPEKIQDITLEAVLAVLEDVKVTPAKEEKLPEGNFYMYGFRFHDEADNSVGITICENGLVVIHGENYNYSYWQGSPKIYKELRALFGDIRDFQDWKKD